MGMSITPNRLPTPDRGCQRGQSSVFVIVFLGITILSLIFLYKAGKLTSEKMELQNAADGIAYSVAILEARDLNFMAYTNRAMVANEVAIGQAVGLASWPRHWESIGYYENALCGTKIEPLGVGIDKFSTAIEKAGQGVQKIPLPPGVFQAIGTIMITIGKMAVKIGEEMGKQCEKIRAGTKKDFIDRGKALAKQVDDGIAIPLAQLMEKANRGLSEAQAIFHLGTMAYVTKTVSQVTQDNVTDNNLGDTGLSPYGLAALLGHLISFGHLAPFGTTPGQRYGPDPNRQASPFIRTHRPGSSGDSKDKKGFERLAAITAAARDEFGKGPRRFVALADFNDYVKKPLPEIPLGICPLKPPIPLCFGWLKFDLNISQGLTVDLDHRAGSELRYVKNAQGDQYNWSSGDTSSGQLGYTLKAEFSIMYAFPSTGSPNFNKTLFSVDGLAGIGGNGIIFGMDITFPIPGFPRPINIPINVPSLGKGFVPGMPFGAGAAQVNNNANNKIDILDSTLRLVPLPLVAPDSYGHAPGGSSVYTMNKAGHGVAAWSGPAILGFLMTPWPRDTFWCPVNKTPAPNIACQVPFVSGWMPNRQINNGGLYTGLKQYSDTTDASDLWGFEGPHIIIALQKSIGDIFSATAPRPTGRFELTESSKTNDVIGAIAKGEVYFKRPSDMHLFRRWDTQKSSSGNSKTLYEEYGSAFNPYWQARLAPLSHADRAVATAQQHGQDLETGSSVASTITASWELDTWIN